MHRHDGTRDISPFLGFTTINDKRKHTLLKQLSELDDSRDATHFTIFFTKVEVTSYMMSHYSNVIQIKTCVCNIVQAISKTF